ncbi:hypothetical protein M8A51_23900 [Schlegelella sp. S2-27]|uniref:SIR2-like domain-containing protein n=1 Tax=Caldimonas mangrovi TaxID=2944811 RepID=A0ABT0YV01_9BURK|nr:hypothetical protein [Caldimonas mangrovi]MCM5682586.1 hypothetical protein [Caldimonas mangrovi]
MRLLVIAGNGLSMAMLGRKPVESVDLSNLFAMGGDVTWPASGKPGFLSYEHCPNLWALGARQTVSAKTAYEVIEQTITAVNACCLADPSSLDDGIYIRAYKELVAYLRYLFVHYDATLQASGFFDAAEVFEPVDWLLEAIDAPAVTDIDVVSFNYDAFLERSLQKKAVHFSIPLLAESPGSKVRVHKPHGSITFCGKTPIDKSAFSINYSGGSTFTEGGIDELEVRYDSLDSHFPMVGILPPAGESERYKHRWIRQIWDKAIAAAQKLGENDLVVLYGLSYWHVDRKEIDMLLGEVSRRARVISVNPYPNPQFEAVCCSLFRSYHSYSNAKQLKRMIK